MDNADWLWMITANKDFIRSESLVALLAVDHPISKCAHMSACFPHLRVHDDRAIDAHHADFVSVRSKRRVAHHVLPPDFLDVALQLHAERAVIPEAVDAAVNLARLEDKSATPT